MAGGIVKGLMLNAPVTVYDAADDSTPILDNATTDGTGAYSLTIPAGAAFDGDFVKVIVTGGPGATMICDIPQGCDAGVAFGDAFAIGAEVSLSAIIPAPGEGETETVNVNAFTTLAARLAEQAAGDQALTDDLLTDAASQVANLFGLPNAALTALTPIDVTSDSAGDAEPGALRAAFLNAALLQVALEAEDEAGAGLAAIIDAFLGNDGQLIVNEASDDPDQITLRDIFEAASRAASASPLSGENADVARAGLGGDLATIAAVAPGTLSNAAPSPSAGLASLDTVKVFVSDLQLIVAAVEDADAPADLEAFADRLDGSANQIEAAVSSLSGSYFEGLEAAFEAYDAFATNGDTGDFTATGGVVVTIVDLGGSASLTIEDAMINGDTVSLEAVVEEDVTSTQLEDANDPFSFFDVLQTQGSGALELAGQVSGDAGLLIVDGGAASLTGLDATMIEDLTITRETETIAIAELELGLAARFQAADPLDTDFEGWVSFGVTGFAYQDSYQFLFDDTGAGFVLTEAEGSALGLEAASAALSGTIRQGADTANVTVSVDAGFDAFELADEPNALPYADVTIDEGAQTIQFDIVASDFRDVVQLVDYQDVLDYAAQFNDDAGTLTDADGDFRGFYAVSNTAEPVFEVARDSTTDEFKPRRWFIQPDTADQLGLSPTAEMLRIGPFVDLALPFDDIVAYHNGIWGATNPGGLICRDGRVLMAPGRLVDPRDPDYDAYILAERPCSEFDPQDYVGPFIGIETTETVEIDGSARVAASVRQDIVGIDPDDSEVEVAVFGNVEGTDGDITGEARFLVSFAGRRFETGSRGFDVFDDLTVPVTVSNQDGVVMTLNEDAGDGRLSGDIALDGEMLATIQEDIEGVVTVNFTDDTFVTLR